MPDSVIEYSIDGGGRWYHGRTVQEWVTRDRTLLRGQRDAVIEQARKDHGNVERVTTRTLPEDDPAAVLNQPPASGWSDGHDGLRLAELRERMAEQRSRCPAGLLRDLPTIAGGIRSELLDVAAVAMLAYAETFPEGGSASA